MNKRTSTIAVIGLGYVGLPLAIAFSDKFKVIGFDVEKRRIDNLLSGIDKTNEVEKEDIVKSDNLHFTSNESGIAQCDTYIITVPTPIDRYNVPNLSYIINATQIVGKHLKKDDLVIYESTVYPGVTDDTCTPMLSSVSGLKINEDFSVGYSPERINPGDKKHRLKDIVKVISASNEDALDKMEYLYSKIIHAGLYKVGSIKEAEAAKIIENTQRDINIALVNEFYQLFSKMQLDTNAILQAARTKWNFLDFRPGLVGGHCIGVDPYYLLYKASEVGFHPEIIHAGRKTNDSMAEFIAVKFLNLLRTKSIEHTKRLNVLVLGFTFKENCPDIRNTKVLEFRRCLIENGCNVDVYDPVCNGEEVKQEYGISLLPSLKVSERFDGVAIMVGHSKILDLSADYISSLAKPGAPIFDFKNLFEGSSFET